MTATHASKDQLAAETVALPELGDYESRTTQFGDYYVRFESSAVSAPTCPLNGNAEAMDRGPSSSPGIERRAYAVTATRRTSVPVMLTPGASQVVTGGTASRACSSVSNRTIEKP
jgi:hypothetical protein